ncbi:alpha-N-acetylgalactosaminidase-like [Anticarsia gemmatalis]|uniref:alpha-N-acetylgalactosaminidase-like n=1 Tax=Anticarsia gemmatalis TaxID=129554 RepID=UPI003F75CA98
MFGIRIVFSLLFFTFILDQVDVLENGLARTPPMGWMSWGYYMCGVECEKGNDKCLNEKLIMSVADTFYEQGYQEAGFEYIIIDDCWAERHRSKRGQLIPDKKRFPRGMKFLAEYIHARGLKFGMYTNIASITCMKFPGSKGYFEVDAKTFAEWDIDYLKVDGCFVTENYLKTAYISLGKSLNETGRPIVYSCSWPYYIKFVHDNEPDVGKVAKYCNLWRNYHDVVMSWTSIMGVIHFYVENYEKIAPYHGPGRWNDPDMLIFGTGALSNGQTRVHIAVYAMWSAPLLLSCDMNKITPYERKLLLNLNLMAIGQDKLGIMAKPYMTDGDVIIFVKPHQPLKGNAYPAFSFAYVNLDIFERDIYFSPKIYGLNNTDPYTILNVFTGVYIRNMTAFESMNIKIPGHDVVLYTFYPL